MSQKKLVGIVILVVGLVLLYFGFNQANSAVGEIGEAITGKYTDETMAYLIAGIIATVVGLFTLLKK
jgi:uncharacterized membrane protein